QQRHFVLVDADARDFRAAAELLEQRLLEIRRQARAVELVRRRRGPALAVRSFALGLRQAVRRRVFLERRVARRRAALAALQHTDDTLDRDVDDAERAERPERDRELGDILPALR